MGNLLSGKTAIVTGSGQGVGRAIAMALSGEGARVVTNNRAPVKRNMSGQLDGERLARLSPEQLEWYNNELEKYSGDAETTAAAIMASGGEAKACFGDISDFNEAKRIVDFVVDSYGSVDIIVNVVGAFGFSPVEMITQELWDKVTDSKPKGHFNIIRHAVPYMKEKGWGRIINCSSPAFLGGGVRQAEYAAANAGVLGLTWSLATELFEDGITANAFCPVAKTRASVDLVLFDKAAGKGETATRTGLPIISQEKYEEEPPPELFAPFFAWLASDEARDVTGSVFMTKGGFIGRYANPAIIASMTSEDGWTVEKVMKTAPDALFKDYKNINQK